MDERTGMFFEPVPEAFWLYERLREQIFMELGQVEIRVQKTQISFYDRHLFACVSFLRVRKKKELPPVYITLTFGLARKAESPRIAVATEPYPGRWTHHVVISAPEEIDGELMGWIREAAEFARGKR